MSRKIQFLAMILAISISDGYAKDPKKIIKGEAASKGEFPHQVSIHREDGVAFCSGSIIGPKLILTAAHCIVEKSGKPVEFDMYVVVGTNDIKLQNSDNVFNVVRRIRHNYQEGYDDKNDIAILQLNKPIRFNDSVKLAKLPHEDVPAGTRVMSSGWGATTYDRSTKKADNYPRYLQKLERTVLPQDQCQELMKHLNKIGHQHICVRSPFGADTCFGDSGGPLTYKGTVIGIASYTRGIGQVGCPAIYTRVLPYLKWIDNVKWYMDHNSPIPKKSTDYVEV